MNELSKHNLSFTCNEILSHITGVQLFSTPIKSKSISAQLLYSNALYYKANSILSLSTLYKFYNTCLTCRDIITLKFLNKLTALTYLDVEDKNISSNDFYDIAYELVYKSSTFSDFFSFTYNDCSIESIVNHFGSNVVTDHFSISDIYPDSYDFPVNFPNNYELTTDDINALKLILPRGCTETFCYAFHSKKLDAFIDTNGLNSFKVNQLLTHIDNSMSQILSDSSHFNTKLSIFPKNHTLHNGQNKYNIVLFGFSSLDCDICVNMHNLAHLANLFLFLQNNFT